MPSTTEQPPESVPPQKRASGAEIAPLVGGDAARPDEEDPVARAQREVEAAEELLRQWKAADNLSDPFNLTVQSIVGEARAVTLVVSSNMTVAELQEAIHAKMDSKPHPRVQQLFIPDGDKGPLHDETLPIGAYGVVSGVALHLALRDGDAAAACLVARAQVREAYVAKVAREAAVAAEVAWRKTERRRKGKRCAQMVAPLLLLLLLVLLITFFNAGCGACQNGATCPGLFGECACTANHLGEYCEHSCGEFGQVNGSTCACSGDRVGPFCDLRMLVRSDFNDAMVGAVMHRGAPQDLTWQLQHELCSDAGKATPGSSKLTDESIATAAPPWGTPTTFQDKHCAFSASDNHVVAGDCQWSDQAFTHVSGSLGNGVGYMCADLDCNSRVRVEGIRATSEVTNEPATLRDGDAVFCSTCQLTEDSCCGVNCGPHGQCSDGDCSCNEGSDLGYGVWLGSGLCGGFCMETDENASYVGAVLVDIFLICVVGVLCCAVGAGVCAGVAYAIAEACCGGADNVDVFIVLVMPCTCGFVCGFMLTLLHFGCKASTPCGTPDSAPCSV